MRRFAYRSCKDCKDFNIKKVDKRGRKEEMGEGRKEKIKGDWIPKEESA